MPTELHLENLRPAPPWKKGQSGNPGGKIRRKPWTDGYKVIANEVMPDEIRLRYFILPCIKCAEARNYNGALKFVPTGLVDGQKCPKCHGTLRIELLPRGSTWARGMAYKLAMDGIAKPNVGAIMEMANRVEGYPAASVQVDANQVKEVRFVVRFEDPDAVDNSSDTIIERRGDTPMLMRGGVEQEKRSGPPIDITPTSTE